MTYANNPYAIPAHAYDALHALPSKGLGIWLDRDELLLPECAYAGPWRLFANGAMGKLILSSLPSGNAIDTADADDRRKIGHICRLFTRLAAAEHGAERSRLLLPREYTGTQWPHGPGQPVRAADLLPPDIPTLTSAAEAGLTWPGADWHAAPWGGQRNADIMSWSDCRGRTMSITSGGRLVVAADNGSTGPRILDWADWRAPAGEPQPNPDDIAQHYNAVVTRWCNPWWVADEAERRHDGRFAAQTAW